MRASLAILAALSLGAGPARAEEPSAEQLARIDEGYRAIYAWQVDEAREKAEVALREAPDDPLTLALVGLVKMHLNDYAGAVSLMHEAQRAGLPAHMLGELTPAEAARVATDGYQEAISEHFVIRHVPGRDAILVPYAIETLEKARERIGTLLGWKPEGRVALELYPSAKTLASVSSLTPEDIENSGTIALCRWNRLMATTPRAVVFGYSWRDTLAHELTHLVVSMATRDRAPLWLQEGVAKRQEVRWRPLTRFDDVPSPNAVAWEGIEAGIALPLTGLGPSIAMLPSPEQATVAFAEVASFVRYWVKQNGEQALPKLLVAIKDLPYDGEVADAIEEVSGTSFAD